MVTSLGSYTALALLFSLTGIYGIVSYSVSQRAHEIGVRMALGAQRSNVLKLFVWRGLLLAVAGVGAGVIGALIATRFIASQLHGVSAIDPSTFAAVSLILIAAVLLATYLPARKASNVDPMVALRHE